MVETEMQEVPRSPVRHALLDGGFALLFLTFAVVTGYVVLAPSGLRAKTLAATQPAAAPAMSAGEVVAPATAEPAREPTPPAPTWPESTVTGRVLDGRREPVANASVVVDGRELRTAADGTFTVEHPAPTASLLVKMPGHEKVTIMPAAGPIEVVLKPKAIKAAYLTYYGIGDRGIRGRVLDLVARTELNAVVIDVKGDRGWILYRTEVPMALTVGAQGPATLKDFDGLMADFKARGIYTIARIVTFKDNVLANARPDLAVVDTRTGKAWIDNEKLAWVDPFREEVWDYNIAIAKEAVRHGFDEVQFDYVRFPTDGRLSAAKYARENNKDTRLPTIAGFLAKARRALGPLGAFVAADVFGYTAFNENDTDIGQRIEELTAHLDYVCPMVYPSGYHRGIPGFRNPVEHPYEVVHESVRLIRKRAANTVVQVRPWIQDFKDYAYDRRIFGVTEIRAQVKGADDAGAAGWMLWNPRNDYTGPALRLKGSAPTTSTSPAEIPTAATPASSTPRSTTPATARN
jgi:hypothetical protein